MELIAERRCCRCRQTKPLGDFCRHRGNPLGRSYYCRGCALVHQRAYRRTVKGKISHRRAVKKHNQRPEVRERRRQAGAKYAALHLREHRATLKVDWAVTTGALVRPGVCSACGAKTKIVGHHKDYNKALDVIWLCDSCHSLLHLKARQIA